MQVEDARPSQVATSAQDTKIGQVYESSDTFHKYLRVKTLKGMACAGVPSAVLMVNLENGECVWMDQTRFYHLPNCSMIIK